MRISKLLVAWLCAILLTPPAFAARGFGTTDGAATTDKMTTTYGAVNSQVTWAMWIWITGAGGANFGRLLGNDADRFIWYDSANTKLLWIVGYSLFGGNWSIARPTTGAWHHLAVTYDSGSTTNDPVMYVDGASVTVTEDQTPSGTLGTSTNAYVIGNRTDGLRNWDGRIAEIGHWSKILTSTEVALLAAGYTPPCVPGSLVAYWPLNGSSPEPDLIGGANGTVTGAAVQTHPTVQYSYRGAALTGVGN